jgi:hypothetical protein
MKLKALVEAVLMALRRCFEMPVHTIPCVVRVAVHCGEHDARCCREAADSHRS